MCDSNSLKDVLVAEDLSEARDEVFQLLQVRSQIEGLHHDNLSRNREQPSVEVVFRGLGHNVLPQARRNLKPTCVELGRILKFFASIFIQ